MFLILTYQLQSVMHYSALWTGLAIVPFALATVLGAAVIAPWLMTASRPGGSCRRASWSRRRAWFR